METLSPGSGSANSTSLVLLNTRMFAGYKSIKEMVKPNAELPWGNNFAFLTIPLPKLRDVGAENPLQFVFKARQIIMRKRMSSFAVYLTAGASKYIHGTMRNTSMGITNVMGPIEQMALASHPVKGLYFVVTGAPQSDDRSNKLCRKA
uniref:O-acyltransferase WSD1 C-terminal domain-containing protein n=1 Tax=Salix viminalis TaxID=40686 RepID=A0A6N2MQ22_SALVM